MGRDPLAGPGVIPPPVFRWRDRQVPLRPARPVVDPGCAVSAIEDHGAPPEPNRGRGPGRRPSVAGAAAPGTLAIEPVHAVQEGGRLLAFLERLEGQREAGPAAGRDLEFARHEDL